MRFSEFQRINNRRCHEAFHMGGAGGWPLQNWGLALAGEVGEFCNLVKKVIRGDFLLTEKRDELLMELADVITYADLAVSKLGADTGRVVAMKFDQVSARVGWTKGVKQVYVAASFMARPKMLEVRDRLSAAGIMVTSRWLDPEWTCFDDVVTARIDLEDLEASDVCMVFTDEPSTRGGMFVELGYAIAAGKQIVCIGPRVNNFLCLESILQFPTVEACLQRGFDGLAKGLVPGKLIYKNMRMDRVERRRQ